FTDASLRIGWKIENTSQKPIALSQMVINKVTFFVRVSDMNDKAVEFPGSERHIDGILRLKELPLVRLEPGEYWGATKQIERYSVRLAKPGKYKIVATISGNTKFPGVVIPNTIAPLWTDDIVSQPIVIQVNKPSK
ncbi:MAG: hypothetical protein NT023_23200, partial [Armatimonadetes bacterium]|nr:hypothetical protein [Armatimonadota bacterium]